MRAWTTGWAAVAMAVVLGAAASARAAEPADYQQVLETKAPALVTVKYVLKIQMGGMGQQESESETTGVMIDPSGLVLVSNTQLGGIGALMRAIGRDITATPTDIKVLVGEDTEGLDAKLIARDTELDLAWVKIGEPGDRKFEYVDLTRGMEPKVGQPVLAVRRMGKFFDRSAVVGEAHIGGITRKPRRLYVPTEELMSFFGLPVFTPQGQLVGVAVMQMPSEEDAEASEAAIMSRMSSMQEMAMGLILPASDVADATRRAKEIAETQPPADETDTPATDGQDEAGDEAE